MANAPYGPILPNEDAVTLPYFAKLLSRFLSGRIFSKSGWGLIFIATMPPAELKPH